MCDHGHTGKVTPRITGHERKDMSTEKTDDAPVHAVVMPILSRERLSGFPVSIEIPVSCESQARQNHGNQSLSRLRERGGLSPDEAVAIMEMREWRPMTVVELVDAFRLHGWLA